ncbi:MAG: hypothetical protein JST12_14885 [Armatimonadetes bacterium]|nr:hypothetical protein [Armatimonadota bacterium]
MMIKGPWAMLARAGIAGGYGVSAAAVMHILTGHPASGLIALPFAEEALKDFSDGVSEALRHQFGIDIHEMIREQKDVNAAPKLARLIMESVASGATKAASESQSESEKTLLRNFSKEILHLSKKPSARGEFSHALEQELERAMVAQGGADVYSVLFETVLSDKENPTCEEIPLTLLWNGPSTATKTIREYVSSKRLKESVRQHYRIELAHHARETLIFDSIARSKFDLLCDHLMLRSQQGQDEKLAEIVEASKVQAEFLELSLSYQVETRDLILEFMDKFDRDFSKLHIFLETRFDSLEAQVNDLTKSVDANQEVLLEIRSLIKEFLAGQARITKPMGGA